MAEAPAPAHGAPAAAAAAGGERDEDLELALRLHRELNAVPRRQRAPPRAQGAAARNAKKQAPPSESSESSEGSSGSEGSGDGKRSGSRAPSDNDSGSKRRRQGGGDKPRKPAQRRRSAGTPKKGQHVAAAEAARGKAGRKQPGSEPRTHVKCFLAGLPHGAWVPAGALASRASLAAAVCAAFQDDGVACSSEAATIVFVGPDRQAREFPGRPGASNGGGEPPGAAANGKGGEAASGEGWDAAARAAVRIYVR